METIKIDWDTYFWQLHDRYCSYLIFEYKKRVKNAGDPIYFREIFQMRLGMEVIFDIQDKFAKEIIGTFEHLYKLDKTQFIIFFLQEYPKIRERHVFIKEKTHPVWHKPKSVKVEYENLLDRVLLKPKSIVSEISVPITFESKLIDITDPRKIVKFLVRYYTIEEMKKLIESDIKEAKEAKENDENKFIDATVTDATLLETDKMLKIGKPNIRHNRNSKITALNSAQTRIFIQYLMQTEIILNIKNQTNVNTAKAFEILTGYAHEGLRKDLSSIDKNKANIREVKKQVEKLLSLINKDLDMK